MQQRRVCFSDNIQLHEIPSRRCDTDLVGGQKRCRVMRSPTSASLRPVNRQLELPGQHSLVRTRSPLAGLRFGKQTTARFVVSTPDVIALYPVIFCIGLSLSFRRLVNAHLINIDEYLVFSFSGRF